MIEFIVKHLMQDLPPKATVVIPFHDAPHPIKSLSDNGGDEDFIIIYRGNEPFIVDALEVCGTQIINVEGTDFGIAITCHS